MWLQIKYERLPSFYFFCGLIGHPEKFYKALFDNPQGLEDRKYDSSLRATMKKQGTRNKYRELVDSRGRQCSSNSDENFR